MNNRHCLTALVTIGALLGAAGSAAADPYADETVSVERVESPDGTYNTNDDKVKSVKDRGNEALGAPNWNAYNVWGRATVLGFDPVTGIGGNAVLAFTDNICLNGPGPDLQIYDAWGNQSAAGDEAAQVEISHNGGGSYVVLPDLAQQTGRVGVDSAGYQLEVGDDLPYFNQVRVTAASTDSWPTISGMDLDAVECLNPVEAPSFDYNLDRCDRADGVVDGDVNSIVAYNKDGMTHVVVEVCGTVSANSEYNVMIDMADPDDLDGDGDELEPDTMLAGNQCRASAEAVVTYKDGQMGGPGVVTNNGTYLEFEIANAELPVSVDPTDGSRLVVWTEVREEGSTQVTSESTTAAGPSDSLSNKAFRKVEREFRKWVKETEKRARRISRWDSELGTAIRELVRDFTSGGGDDTAVTVVAGDNAPNTEPGDGCATPQLRAEVLELVAK